MLFDISILFNEIPVRCSCYMVFKHLFLSVLYHQKLIWSMAIVAFSILYVLLPFSYIV